jgi:hypothetical protein
VTGRDGRNNLCNIKIYKGLSVTQQYRAAFGRISRAGEVAALTFWKQISQTGSPTPASRRIRFELRKFALHHFQVRCGCVKIKNYRCAGAEALAGAS